MWKYNLLTAIGYILFITILVLSINSVSAGGIYRYHDEDAYKAYRAQEAYKKAKQQYKLMQKRARNYKKLARYHKKATDYTRACERQDARTFDSEAKVWDFGVTVEPLYRPGLDFNNTKIRRVNH